MHVITGLSPIYSMSSERPPLSSLLSTDLVDLLLMPIVSWSWLRTIAADDTDPLQNRSNALSVCDMPTVCIIEVLSFSFISLLKSPSRPRPNEKLLPTRLGFVISTATFLRFYTVYHTAILLPLVYFLIWNMLLLTLGATQIEVQSFTNNVQYPLQEAIDEAQAGDTVMLTPGMVGTGSAMCVRSLASLDSN